RSARLATDSTSRRPGSCQAKYTRTAADNSSSTPSERKIIRRMSGDLDSMEWARRGNMHRASCGGRYSYLFYGRRAAVAELVRVPPQPHAEFLRIPLHPLEKRSNNDEKRRATHGSPSAASGPYVSEVVSPPTASFFLASSSSSAAHRRLSG